MMYVISDRSSVILSASKTAENPIVALNPPPLPSSAILEFLGSSFSFINAFSCLERVNLSS